MASVAPAEVPRPQLADLGLFLLLVASPLLITPFSSSPFGDAKLVCLTGGTLALWAAGTGVDRRILWAGLAWLAVTVAAALVGVDVAAGLTAQANSGGGGAILVGCLAILAATGAAAPPVVLDRARAFLVGGGLAVAVVAIVFRIAPDAFESLFPGQALRGSTLGNPVFGIAFCAAALAATLGEDRMRRSRQLIAVGVLAFASATFEQRSALILPVVAMIVVLARSRQERRRWMTVAGVVLGSLALFQIVRPSLPPLDTTTLGDFQSITSDAARLAVWDATIHGWTERPFLGWGPSSTQTAYVGAATVSQIELAGRHWGDAHDLVVETLATSGIVGLAAFLVLAGILAIRAARADRRRAWALGGAVSLCLFALGEPINAVTTPLLFLLAGFAAGGSVDVTTSLPTWFRTAVGAVLVVTVGVTCLMLASATFERWGSRYDEVWALETSLDLQPWRLSAREDLGELRASDAAANHPGALQEMRAIIDETVAQHPWDPDVRLWAAQLEHFAGHDDAAIEWLQDQARWFPVDERLIELARAAIDRGFSIPGAGGGMQTDAGSSPPV